jgi:hypothetical protein
MLRTAAQVKSHVWVGLMIEIARTKIQFLLGAFYNINDGLGPFKMGREVILIFGPDLL